MKRRSCDKSELEPGVEHDDVLKKRPRIRWCEEKRIALLLLCRRYKTKWIDLRDVWQQVFSADLTSNGRSQNGSKWQGATVKALQAQFEELMRQEKPAYNDVYLETNFDELPMRYAHLDKRIIEAAEIAAVTLVPGQREEKSCYRADRAPVRLRPSKGQQDLAMSDSDSSTLIGDLSSASEKSQHLSWSKTSRRKQTSKSFGQTLGQSPQLFFRTYSVLSAGTNGSSGFKSGYEPRHNFDPFSTQGIKAAAVHLNAAKYKGNFIPTPFISITNSLIFAVNKAIQLRKRGVDTRLAVIDGRPPLSLIRAADLIQEVIGAGLARWEWPYAGNYEFMVLGRIDSSAVIADFPLSDFLALAATDVAVGSLLRLDVFEQKNTVSSIRRVLESNTSCDTATMNEAIDKLISWMIPSFNFKAGPLMDEFRSVILQNWHCPSEPNHVVQKSTADENQSTRTLAQGILTPSSIIRKKWSLPSPANDDQKYAALKTSQSERRQIRGIMTPSSTVKRKYTVPVEDQWLWSPYENFGNTGCEDSPCANRVKRARGV